MLTAGSARLNVMEDKVSLGPVQSTLWDLHLHCFLSPPLLWDFFFFFFWDPAGTQKLKEENKCLTTNLTNPWISNKWYQEMTPFISTDQEEERDME